MMQVAIVTGMQALIVALHWRQMLVHTLPTDALDPSKRAHPSGDQVAPLSERALCSKCNV